MAARHAAQRASFKGPAAMAWRLCGRSSMAELTDNTSRRQISLDRDNLQAAAASGKSTCRMLMTALSLSSR